MATQTVLPRETVDTDYRAALLLDSAAGYVERGWTTGAAARREDAFPCSAIDEEAVSWCATGALYAAEFATGLRRMQGVTAGTMTEAEIERAHTVRIRAEEALKDHTVEHHITPWNDRQYQSAENVAASLRETATRLRGWECPVCYESDCVHAYEPHEAPC